MFAITYFNRTGNSYEESQQTVEITDAKDF